MCIWRSAAQQDYFGKKNYSTVNKLPIVFICENNLYATYSNFNSNFVSKNLSEIVKSYKCSSKVTSTFDYKDLKSSILLSLKNVEKKGPFFLEILTYRLGPHVGPESDGDKKYRSNEELNFWKSHDLINIYQKEFNLIFNKEVKIIDKNLKILYNKSAKQNL